MAAKTVLVLRACSADLTSTNNFKWPESGYVEAPDWLPTEACGNGLHGWAHGHGSGRVSDYWNDTDKWLVVKVKTKDMIDLEGKVKFKCGEVVFCGDRKGATDYILKRDKIAYTRPVIGAIIEVGDNGSAITGYGGVAISKYKGISVSDENGKSTSGDCGKSISGSGGVSISGHYGTSFSGECGVSESGMFGESISGSFGKSISGSNGTSISGYSGTSIVDNRGKAQSGVHGTIIIKYLTNSRAYSKVGHIGEDGLEPNVLYMLDNKQNFIPAPPKMNFLPVPPKTESKE